MMGGGWLPVVMIPTQGDMPAECASTLFDIFEWLTDTNKYDIFDLDIDDEDGVDKLHIKGSVKTIEVLIDIFVNISYFELVQISDTQIILFYNPDADTPITTLDIQQRYDDRLAARISDNEKDLGEGQPPREADNEAPDLKDMLDDMLEQAEVQEELKEQLEKRGQVQSEHDKPTALTEEAKQEIQKHKQGQKTCFVEGTLVETPNGPQEINNLTVGDPVYAYEDGELVVVDVEKCYVGQAEGYHTVTFDNGSDFKVTSEHPVYVRINEEWTWMSVKELNRYDEVMILNMDESLTVGRVLSNQYQESDFPVEVYNLEVDDPHTYFAEGVLVHNKDMKPGPPGPPGPPMPGPPGPPQRETPEDKARKRAMERMEEIQQEVEKAKRDAEEAAKQAENMPQEQQETPSSSSQQGPEGEPQPDSQGESDGDTEDQSGPQGAPQEGDEGGADGAGQGKGDGDGDGDDDGNCQNCGPDDDDQGGQFFGIYDKGLGEYL